MTVKWMASILILCATFRLVYTPLAQHKGVGSVSFSNANAEEFWYALRLDADDVESLKLAKATELD
jgi:hypothetical protein